MWHDYDYWLIGIGLFVLVLSAPATLKLLKK